jgi:hypothetical protein
MSELVSALHVFAIGMHGKNQHIAFNAQKHIPCLSRCHKSALNAGVKRFRHERPLQVIICSFEET